MTDVDARERRLIQLLCGTKARRRARLGEISALLAEVDTVRLVALLKRIGLLVLIGRRLLALGLRDAPELERELESSIGPARKWGTATELASLEVLHQLEVAGIRALPLKGSLLARELYGDVAARSSIDIDVLVAPDDLRSAVTAVAELGWRWQPSVWRVGGLPTLHETLVHPSLPRVELHWRVHWYEQRFAVDALARAQQSATGEPLQMEPVDGLVTLMLFYARDGFAGLRFPTDAATWWDVRCSESNTSPPLDAVLRRYPELIGPVRVASVLLCDLVGLPTRLPTELPFRWRLAAEVASPFVEAGPQQAVANAALADLLLAPGSAAADAVRRINQNAPASSRRTQARSPTPRLASVGHLMRVFGRWIRAVVPAIARILVSGRRTRR
jgi:hypothetical protein